MRKFLTHPGAGAVVGTEDPRRPARLWGLAVSEHPGTDLLCLDNVGALIATIDEVLGPGQGNALLEAVIRTTSVADTPLLLTAPLVTSITRWAGSMGLRLILGAAIGAQTALADLPHGMITGSTPGRSVILDGATATTCRVVLRADSPVSVSECDGTRTLWLESLPTRLTWEDVPEGAWAVGRDAAAPVALPVHTSVLVARPPGSGRSTALRAPAQAVASDPLVVDDLNLVDIATVTQMEATLTRSEVALIFASTEKVATTSRGAISTMCERETLVMPWSNMRPVGQAAGISLRSVTDPRAITLPGRGALVYHGTCLSIQIVQPQPEDNDRPIEYPV